MNDLLLSGRAALEKWTWWREREWERHGKLKQESPILGYSVGDAWTVDMWGRGVGRPINV